MHGTSQWLNGGAVLSKALSLVLHHTPMSRDEPACELTTPYPPRQLHRVPSMLTACK